MSVTYATILRQAAIRVNALVGTTPSALETNYLAALASTSFDSADFPFTLFKDTCLAVEGKLASAIANTGNHPWRSFLSGVTSALASGDLLPSLDSTSSPIIGVWGSVRDGSDSTPLTEMAFDDIRIEARNANTWLVTPIYGYKIDGTRIFHTRTTVIVDCCVYNRATRTTIIGTLTNSTLLPDALEEAMVCGMVSMLVRDDAFMPQAQIYRGYFNDALASIAQGLTSVVSKTIPAPSLVGA